MKLTTLRADLLLLVAAAIWGSGFVAQRLGAEHLSAFAYTGLRFMLGAVLLLPLLAFARWPADVDRAASRRATLRGGLIAGTAMLPAATAQQHGVGATTVGNSAFITSLYVVLVPFLSILVVRAPIGRKVWTGVGLAMAGLALMGIQRDFTVRPGDPWILLSAALWAAHVVVVGVFSRDAEPIRMTILQLGFTGLGALAGALACGDLGLERIEMARGAILYGAILPVAVAFTLQVIAQRKAPPTHAALIISLESVFGMACGILFLAERPSGQQYAGAALMLAGVVLSQLPAIRQTEPRRSGPRSAG